MIGRRVKITGIGPVTPAGVGREGFWRGIQEPVSRIRKFRGLDSQHGAFSAAYLDNFKLSDYLESPGPLQRAARHTQFALAGAQLALADAGISNEEVRKVPVVVSVGASLMDFGGICDTVDSVAKKGSKGALIRTIFSVNPASISGSLISHFGIDGTAITVQSSCCASIDAIGLAARSVAAGESEIAICGGTEAPLHRHPLLELRAAELTPDNPDHPEKQCRPFDLWRTTGVVSEGACLLILEPESSPRSAIGWIKGYGTGSDKNGETFTGLVRAAQTAVMESNLLPADVDAINAWGPGHRQLDFMETKALHEIFDSRLGDLPTVSIKGAVGNPLGAAGSIQVASSLLTLNRDVIPPTVNWDYPDPACRLSLSNQARLVPAENILVNSHGLSGSNACLVVSKF